MTGVLLEVVQPNGLSQTYTQFWNNIFAIHIADLLTEGSSVY